MRNILPIVVGSATIFAGCHSPSSDYPSVAAPAFHPTFITSRGTNTSSDGFWQVVVSSAGDSLDLSHHESLKGKNWSNSVWTTDSPHGWTAKAGWFVYIESDSRIWAYDGERFLRLLTFTPGSGAWYGPSRFPCAVPAEVLSRLSEPARRAIETHE